MEKNPSWIRQNNEAGENCLFYVLPDEELYSHSWKEATLNLLLEYPIEKTKRNREGKTAYDYAKEARLTELAEVIKPAIL